MEENFDKEIQDAQANPNPTDHTETTDQSYQEATPDIDYEVKFKASAKEAQRLYEHTKELERTNAELLSRQTAAHEVTQGQTMENLYPGYELLDQDAQSNLIAFSEGVAKRAKAEILNDPAIAFAQRNYNEDTWNRAFAKVLNQNPELADSKDEFKNKYFDVNNVPTNIESLLGDIAKIHLFDKSKEIGAQEEKSKQSRIETERTTGGNRTVSVGRSLDEWARIAQENPAKFSSMSKEYNADLSSGKLRE